MHATADAPPQVVEDAQQGEATSAVAPLAEKVRATDLCRFAWGFCQPHLRLIILSLIFMAFTTALGVLIPLAGREIISFGFPLPPSPEHHSNYTNAANATAEGGQTMKTIRSGYSSMGAMSESLFASVVPALLFWRRSADSMSDTYDDQILESIICRCLLMAVSMASFFAMSCAAHLMAYRSGMAAKITLIQQSLDVILRTNFPERIAVVNSVKLSQAITSSGQILSDTLGLFLTDFVQRGFTAIGYLVAILIISTRLTVLIVGFVAVVQGFYHIAGRSRNIAGGEVSAAESDVQAFLSNGLQRSETISVFQCRDFVLRRLSERLNRMEFLTNTLNYKVHGYTAASSGSTMMIFVVVLGVCNYYRIRGEMDVTNIMLYFSFLHGFMGSVADLSHFFTQLRAALDRLATLYCAWLWYGEARLAVPADDPAAPRVEWCEEGSTSVSLEAVSFAYPVIPAFMRVAAAGAAEKTEEDEDGVPPLGIHKNGIHGISLKAHHGQITALYGPSGSGKSTCLRLLSGIVRPDSGRVYTHRHAVLLEQKSPIFIGTVAENILLQDLSGLKMTDGSDETKAQSEAVENTIASRSFPSELKSRVSEAARLSGCSSFLQNPFNSYIESIDQPQYSGGQLQRISLARVFAQKEDCTLVLLDEPTTGLDVVSVSLLLQTIKDLRDLHHKTVLISTHDHRVADIADQVINLTPPH